MTMANSQYPIPNEISFQGANIYLEVQRQRELNDSRVHRGGRNRTECGSRNIRARVAELRGVEGVEKLRAEFDVGAFTQQFERRSLDDREVEVSLVRPEDY